MWELGGKPPQKNKQTTTLPSCPDCPRLACGFPSPLRLSWHWAGPCFSSEPRADCPGLPCLRFLKPWYRWYMLYHFACLFLFGWSRALIQGYPGEELDMRMAFSSCSLPVAHTFPPYIHEVGGYFNISSTEFAVDRKTPLSSGGIDSSWKSPDLFRFLPGSSVLREWVRVGPETLNHALGPRF